MVLSFILEKLTKNASKIFLIGLLFMFIGFGFFLSPIYDKLYDSYVDKEMASKRLYIDNDIKEKNITNTYGKEQYYQNVSYNIKNKIIFPNNYVYGFLILGLMGLVLSICSIIKNHKD